MWTNIHLLRNIVFGSVAIYDILYQIFNAMYNQLKSSNIQYTNQLNHTLIE